MAGIEKNIYENNEEPGSGNHKALENDFLDLFSAQSLMSHNNNIAEFDAIKDAVEEVLKSHRNKSTNEAVRQSIPKLVVMTTEQSPNLPGIILYVHFNSKVYLMPVLFYKKGVVDVLDDYSGHQLGNQPTYTKFAETFMNSSVRNAVKDAFKTIGTKQISEVYPVSSYVIDVGHYISASKDEELAVKNISNAIMNEWYTAGINFSLQIAAKNGAQITASPFRGKSESMFGKDNTALARIDIPETPLIIGGRVEPYNLMVKLIAAPKGDANGNSNGNNLNQAKMVATTYLNIDLELMSTDYFRREVSRERSRLTRGPLVPVISVGRTLPGQQLQHNESILCDIIGIYNALTVNNPLSFSEALRQRQVGARGCLANLAKATYAVAGDAPPPEKILTTKSMLNQKEVQEFMESYISTRAVFVKDLATYVDSPSNSEIWWNAIANNTPGGNVYKKSLYMALNKVSGGRLKDYIEENQNLKDVWLPGRPILSQSSHIIPVGTAVRDNQLFNLEEIGQMMLHDPVCYGDNAQAVGQFMSLMSGSCNRELRVRQNEIKRHLEEIFGASLNIIGFKSRWIFEDMFLNAVVKLVGGNTNIQVTSHYGTRSWENQPSNDYLTMTSSAVVRNGGGVGGATMTAHSNW